MLLSIYSKALTF